ncbi:putative hexose carrier protein [Ilyonectria destructans]|nr:putative hexose carrier protein [Ilyonectria destructans]
MSSPTFLGLKGQPLVYAVTLCCGLGFLLFGYDLGFMGGLTTSNDFLNQFGNPGASLLGFLISSYELGAMIGALYIFLFGDKFGRKPNVMIGAGIISIGAIIQTASFSVVQFLIGRVISGFGLGMMTAVIPVWLTECANPKSRGRMAAMQLSNLILGLIIANWLDYGMASYSGSVQWRFPCAFQIIFCVIIGCYIPFLPESPRFLVREGRFSDASKSLAALRGSDDIAEEIGQIKYAVEIEAEQGSWSDIFKNGGVSGRTRVIIAFWVNAMQQLTGSNVISSLGPYVFQHSIGLSRHDALLVSAGNQVYFFLSSLIAWWAVDRFGRRRLFMFGSAGMTLCMALSAVFVGIGTKSLGYGAVVVLYVFYTFFTVGWQANMWIYPSEILPLKLRVRGGAIGVVSQWAFTFLVVQITPVLITNIGYKSYIVFAALNFAAIPVVYFFFPETNQLPLEAVDLLFSRDGQTPNLLQVVRESTDKNVQEAVRAGLHNKVEELLEMETKANVVFRENLVDAA